MKFGSNIFDYIAHFAFGQFTFESRHSFVRHTVHNIADDLFIVEFTDFYACQIVRIEFFAFYLDRSARSILFVADRAALLINLFTGSEFVDRGGR